MVRSWVSRIGTMEPTTRQYRRDMAGVIQSFSNIYIARNSKFFMRVFSHSSIKFSNKY